MEEAEIQGNDFAKHWEVFSAASRCRGATLNCGFLFPSPRFGERGDGAPPDGSLPSCFKWGIDIPYSLNKREGDTGASAEGVPLK
jgi:hypothetical protein